MTLDADIQRIANEFNEFGYKVKPTKEGSIATSPHVSKGIKKQYDISQRDGHVYIKINLVDKNNKPVPESNPNYDRISNEAVHRARRMADASGVRNYLIQN